MATEDNTPVLQRHRAALVQAPYGYAPISP